MRQHTPAPPPRPPRRPLPAARCPLPAARRPVNPRSVLLGLAGVCFVCTLTPYNNYVVNNTDFIGSYLPTALQLFLLVVLLAVNAPLHRWAPRQALSGSELAVVVGMTLVGCALPSVGLMRYLPGHLVAFFGASVENPDFASLMRTLDLPDWMFPRFASTDPAARGREAVVRDFFARIPLDDPSFLARLRAVPWGHWLTPALTWGLFFACLFGAVLCLMVIFRRQWVENERLPFPIASIFLSLIEPPEKGRALNGLFASRSFWAAFAVVFFVHSTNALHVYFPRTVPALPMGFDFTPILADPPFVYVEWQVKQQTLFFTIVALAFFLQTKVAFSLWSFYLATQLARMVLGGQQQVLTEGMQQDQLFGALIPFTLAILWVGRGQLATVGRQMLGRPRRDDPEGRYLPYFLAGWGLLACWAGMVAWLVTAGASVPGAVVIVLGVFTLYLVVAKVVAETGLLYVLLPVPLFRPWVFALNEFPQALATRTTLRSYFFAAMFSGVLTHDLRETSSVYVSHALRISDSAYAGERNWRRAIPLVAALGLALGVAFIVSGVATLYTHYSHASTLDRSQTAPIGWWGSYQMPREIALTQTLRYHTGTGPHEAHSRLGHFTFGAGLTTLLSVMRLRFTGWPFHPVGFLMAYTWGMRSIWFSLFIGWVVKVALLQYGGSGLYYRSRNFFIGLIIGEAAAAGLWLTVSLVLASLGYDYHAIRLLPA